MKKSSFVLTMWVAAASFSVFTGCNSVSSSSQQTLGVPNYPPTNPAQVQVLHQMPTRRYIELGQVRAEPARMNTPASYIEDALRKEGAKLGADAVVVIYDRDQVTGAVVTGPWYGRSVQQIEGRVVVGVALKYQ